MESVNIYANDIPFNILLAEDDEDDQYFFDKALKKMAFNKQYTAVDDGAALMTYLLQLEKELPDVLFLDYNMPCKNGAECLAEIKKHPRLKDLPVIMYSTHMSKDMADSLYDLGAYFYVHKTDEQALENMLKEVYTLLMVQKTGRPPKEKFMITF